MEAANFTLRETELLKQGYSAEFIRSVNTIDVRTKLDIAEQIFRYITRDSERTAHPTAVYLGGQPGSGKSVLSRTIRETARYQDLAVVCMDNYRTWHPGYARIEEAIREHWQTGNVTVNDSPGNDIANFTHEFAGEIADILLQMLTSPLDGKYYSVCIEWGLRTPEKSLDSLRIMKEKGYRTEVWFVAVPAAVSWNSCVFRADRMKYGSHIFRRVPQSFHEICLSTLPASCRGIYEKGYRERRQIDRMLLMDREQKILWDAADGTDPGICYQTILQQKAETGPCSSYHTRQGLYMESLGILQAEKWFSYLLLTDEQRYNVERIRSVERSHKNYVLNYTERTLSYIDEEALLLPDGSELPEEYLTALIRSLQWAETAKCGSVEIRRQWEQKGYDLYAHNLGSAAVYAEESSDSDRMKELVGALIASHGIWGQYLRGETGPEPLKPLLEMLKEQRVRADCLETILYHQNRAVIKAASPEIWESVKADIRAIVGSFCKSCLLPAELSVSERLKRLFPSTYGSADALSDDETELFGRIFRQTDLWYPRAALDSFTREEITGIFRMALRQLQPGQRHLSFERLMRSLYYDYEGTRRVNIYKKRIFEAFLRSAGKGEMTSPHMQAEFRGIGPALLMDIRFSPACEALIAFCVEAERSGLMEYQKNITAVFDLFGFRRDIFDRLNNEEKYLSTMNDTQKSRKNEIIDYIVGSSAADVGSGGGVLLDEIEKRYPGLRVLGTDISENVIENLQKKILDEGHDYTVIRHNFVEGCLPGKVDNVVFSSILHEVFSYTEFDGRRFNIDAVRTALAHARDSLNPGGRIIIRDGVLSPGNEQVGIRLKTEEGMIFAKNYLKDFQGLPGLRDENGGWKADAFRFLPGNRLAGDINLIREFLYTYTWGLESYSCEVNEQFGYLRLEEYTALLKELGLSIVHAEQYLEPGYPEHLSETVELGDGLQWEMMPSSCFLVAELS